MLYQLKTPIDISPFGENLPVLTFLEIHRRSPIELLERNAVSTFAGRSGR